MMAIIRKELKEKSKNVLLRVSIPAPLMAEIKKIKKLCRDTGFYFDIKPDVISAVEQAVEEAKALIQKEKKSRQINTHR
jgi:MoaA/NifB/PqqE/SkfB family radical SAM enzyme